MEKGKQALSKLKKLVNTNTKSNVVILIDYSNCFEKADTKRLIENK